MAAVEGGRDVTCVVKEVKKGFSLRNWTYRIIPRMTWSALAWPLPHYTVISNWVSSPPHQIQQTSLRDLSPCVSNFKILCWTHLIHYIHTQPKIETVPALCHCSHSPVIFTTTLFNGLFSNLQNQNTQYSLLGFFF